MYMLMIIPHKPTRNKPFHHVGSFDTPSQATKRKKCAHGTGSLITLPISRFDISASGIGFDLNTRLLPPVLVESTCRAACAHAQ